jgi:hypothetical protein
MICNQDACYIRVTLFRYFKLSGKYSPFIIDNTATRERDRSPDDSLISGAEWNISVHVFIYVCSKTKERSEIIMQRETYSDNVHKNC